MSFRSHPKPTWTTAEQTAFLESRFPEYLKALATQEARELRRAWTNMFLDFNKEFPVQDRSIPSPENVIAYSEQIYNQVKGRKKVCIVRNIILLLNHLLSS
jgi:hypothetical protein